MEVGLRKDLRAIVYASMFFSEPKCPTTQWEPVVCVGLLREMRKTGILSAL